MTEPKALKPGWRRVKFGDVMRISKARSKNPQVDGIERYVGLEHLFTRPLSMLSPFALSLSKGAAGTGLRQRLS